MRHKVSSELRYPGLWRGNIGAWSTVLGPSGSTLTDQSPNRNYASFGSGLNPATAWGVFDGRNAITTVATTTGTIKATVPCVGLTQCTLQAWIYRAASTGDAINVGTSTTNSLSVIWYSDNKLYLYGPGNASGSFNTAANTNTGWCHVSLAYNGTADLRVSLNGTQLANTFSAGIAPAASLTSGALEIGREYHNGIVATTFSEVSLFSGLVPEAKNRIYATRPGIAYETIHRRSYKSAAVAGNRRRRLLLTGTN